MSVSPSSDESFLDEPRREKKPMRKNSGRTILICFCVLCVLAALVCAIVALVWVVQVDSQSISAPQSISDYQSRHNGASLNNNRHHSLSNGAVLEEEYDFAAEAAAYANPNSGAHAACVAKQCPLGEDFACHRDTCLSTTGRCSKSAHRCEKDTDCCFCFEPHNVQVRKLCTAPLPPPPPPPTPPNGGICLNKVCPGAPQTVCERDLCIVQIGTNVGKCSLTSTECSTDAQCCQCRAATGERLLCRPPVLVPRLCPEKVCPNRNFACYTDHCVPVPGTNAGKCRLYPDQACKEHADCECICRIKSETGGVPIIEKCSRSPPPPPPPPPQCPLRKCPIGPATEGLCQPGKCVETPNADGIVARVCALSAGNTAIPCETDANCCVCENPLAVQQSIPCQI